MQLLKQACLGLKSDSSLYFEMTPYGSDGEVGCLLRSSPYHIICLGTIILYGQIDWSCNPTTSWTFRT